MAESTKETIYIDIDDEITSIIEKVRKSNHKILALVLPKRATTLQSIVNMKLLKHTADSAKKNIVLITSEANILPLAGAVGLHVAKTLQSKPTIPDAPSLPKAMESVEEADPDEEPELDDAKSVGELAGLPAEEAVGHKAAPEETIDIDNSADETDKETPKKKGKKDKSDKRLKVPNFDQFRTRLILGAAALILLIILWFIAFRVLPKATVTIHTTNVSATDNPSLTISTDTKSLDTNGKIIPATIQDAKETGTQKANATGQKNVGNKASGTVSLQNCTHEDGSVTVPAGTAVTSGNFTFITQTTAVLPASSFSGGGHCQTNTKDVSVTAQAPGSAYNIGAGNSFAVSGFSTVSGSNGDSMSGGTDQTVTVLSQADIDGAKQKITSNTDQAKNDLSKGLQAKNLFPVAATLSSDTPAVTTTANAGDQVSQVTVTVVTTYHMLGVKQDDLQQVIKNDVKDQIDTSKQDIIDYGLSSASFNQVSKKSNNDQTLTMQTTVVAGAQINTDSIKQQIAGKKKGEEEDLIKALPSVDGVTTKFSPFWVSKIPTKQSRITITVDKPQAKTK